MLTRAEETARLHLDTARRTRQGYNQWQSLLNSLHVSTFRPGVLWIILFLNVVHKGIMGTSCFGACQEAVRGFCRKKFSKVQILQVCCIFKTFKME